MFRALPWIVPILLFQAVTGQAGTITLSCSGPTTVGTSAVTLHCSNGGGFANGMIDASGFVTVNGLAGETVDIFGRHTGSVPGNASYSANLTVDFLSGPAGLTNGFFMPCLTGSLFMPPATASGRFGTVWNAYGNSAPNNTCTDPINTLGLLPFSLGVAQSYAVALSVTTASTTAYAGMATSSWKGFRIFDASGSDITSQVTFTVTEAIMPEPSEALAVLCGLVYCLVRRKRCR